MKKLLNIALNFKVLMLIYFAGFIFVYLFLDLVWWKTGVLSTTTMWQILGLAIVFSVTQHLVCEQNILRTDSRKKQIAVHFAVNYLLLLALHWLFGWSNGISLTFIISYTVVFIVAFAGIYFGFSIYYREMGNRMNIQLEKYKKP